MGLSHNIPNIKQTVVAGGAAGAITVTGIKPRDFLIAVLHIIGTATELTGGEDLTAEFTISAADTIDNTDGTATTNGILIVTYAQAAELGGDLNR